MNDVDQRIRAALHAAADRLGEDDLRPADPPVGPTRSAALRARWGAVTLAAAAVIAVVAGVTALVSNQTAAEHRVSPGRSAPGTPLATASGTTVAGRKDQARIEAELAARLAAARAQRRLEAQKRVEAQRQLEAQRQGTHDCSFADVCATPPADQFFYEPLWPFTNYARARQWETRGAGSQPWHLDAGATALLFTRQFLGFTDITTVTSTKLDKSGAHIGVGYDRRGGGTQTAAVLHLLRYSADRDDTKAGWEVVGSDDTDFSITEPAYGSTVASGLVVGGRLTGVDENIVVRVRNQADTIMGHAPTVAAGGTDQPWTTTVNLTGKGVLTIVAFTGGHTVEHERFAIQGVHT